MKQSSSEPLEEKPFLTEEDKTKAWRRLFSGDNGVNPLFESGYDAAASKANARISSLESELKALREERDKFAKDVTSLWIQLASITLSMKAHPDCQPGSEFEDMVSISEKLLDQFKATKPIP